MRAIVIHFDKIRSEITIQCTEKEKLHYTHTIIKPGKNNWDKLGIWPS